MWPRKGPQNFFSFCGLCIQFPLNLLSAEPGLTWKWKSLRVGKGLSTVFPPQRPGEGPARWKGWPGDHHPGPGRGGRTWELDPGYLARVLLWGSGEEEGITRKGNAEQTDLTWGGAKSIHFFLWSFVIFNFSPIVKTVTAVHCSHALLGKSFALSHICLSNSVASSEVRF